MALIGYARVSSVGQTLDVQLDKLKHCNKVFQEKKSGASDKRPRLTACLEYVREGDVLVVTKLDRLARSTLDLCQIAAQLKRKQVHLQVLDQSIDTTNATGRLLFNMLGAIAQFETEIRAERQREGIDKARQKGIQFGPRKKLTDEQITELKKRRKAHCVNIEWDTPSLEFSVECEAKEEHYDTKTGRQNQQKWHRPNPKARSRSIAQGQTA